jgi:hypothetical protein
MLKRLASCQSSPITKLMDRVKNVNGKTMTLTIKSSVLLKSDFIRR